MTLVLEGIVVVLFAYNLYLLWKLKQRVDQLVEYIGE